MLRVVIYFHIHTVVLIFLVLLAITDEVVFFDVDCLEHLGIRQVFSKVCSIKELILFERVLDAESSIVVALILHDYVSLLFLIEIDGKVVLKTQKLTDFLRNLCQHCFMHWFQRGLLS